MKAKVKDKVKDKTVKTIGIAQVPTQLHRRFQQSNEIIFYDKLKTLITNLLISNKNYTNGYYSNHSWDHDVHGLVRDTQERARYILNTMDEIKHLIDL